MGLIKTHWQWLLGIYLCYRLFVIEPGILFGGIFFGAFAGVIYGTLLILATRSLMEGLKCLALLTAVGGLVVLATPGL
jgi:hypothetical protein